MGIYHLTLEATACLHAFLFPHTALAGTERLLVHKVKDIVHYEKDSHFLKTYLRPPH